MAKRRGFKRLTLQDRLTAWAKKTREHANELEPGPYRDALLQKADKANPQHDLMHGRGRRDRSRLRMRSEQRGQVMKERPFSGEHISGPEKVMLLVIAVGVIVLIAEEVQRHCAAQEEDQSDPHPDREEGEHPLA